MVSKKYSVFKWAFAKSMGTGSHILDLSNVNPKLYGSTVIATLSNQWLSCVAVAFNVKAKKINMKHTDTLNIIFMNFMLLFIAIYNIFE